MERSGGHACPWRRYSQEKTVKAVKALTPAQEVAAILATLVERGMRIEGDALTAIKPLLPENVQAFLPGPMQGQLAAGGMSSSAPSLGAASAAPAPPAAAPSLEDTIANRTSELWEIK